MPPLPRSSALSAFMMVGAKLSPLLAVILLNPVFPLLPVVLVFETPVLFVVVLVTRLLVVLFVVVLAAALLIPVLLLAVDGAEKAMRE